MIHKTTRSILSVLLAALLLVASIPLTPAFAGDGGAVSLQSESGEGRALEGAADGVYYISSAEELWDFAEKVNDDGETTANAVLTADIVLNEKIEVDENGTVTNQEDLSEWTPIGNSINQYTGTFDGDGHTISGLYIKNTSSDTDYQGLFGFVDSEGTVQNLSVSGSVSGNNYVSGVVGQNHGSVEDCDFTGSVSGNNYIGGVVGYNGGTVENCHNIGEVSGNRYVGGIVGYNGTGATVSNCYNTGTITGTDDYVVGVVGYNNGGTVENCHNIGEVSGNSYVVGVVGSNNNGTVENCYNTGSVTGTDDYVGGVVGYNYGSVTNCYNTGSVSGLDSGSGNSVGGVVGYNISSVTNCYNTGSVSGPDNGNSNQVGGVVGRNDSGTVKNCYNTGSVSGPDSGSDSNVGGVVGLNSASVTNCYNTGKVSGPDSGSGNYVGGVVGDNRGTVTGCYFLKGTAEKGIGSGRGDATSVTTLDELCENFENDNTNTWTISDTLNRPVLKDNHEDDGTQAHPYRISTATQLENFRDLVNDEGGQAANPNAHAKLMNNIDLSSVCGEELNNGNPVSWTPIGTSEENAYTGNFNGNGHTISGLYIDSSDNYQGLFGCLDQGGTVKDLSVSGSVKGHSYVGGVVGYNDRGTVTGCIFSGSGSVSGSYSVGGVVGYNYSGGSVTNCYNIGEVSGYEGVGGVVGDNRGSVTGCIFSGSGTVTGTGDYVGGVVGQNFGGTVENCYNTGTGTVTGTDDYVGGVVGDNSGPVTNCYNTGAVNSSGNNVGGVVGDNSGPVKNCYNTGTVSGSDYVGGVVGENSGSNGVVENCHNAGKVSGRYVGGVVGSNSGTVENCYNTDSVSDGTTSGGVVGQNSGSVTNCYFLPTTEVNNKLQGIGGGSGTSSNVEPRTADAFHSGEVAWLLQAGQTDGSSQVWGQSNLKDKNSWPTLIALDNSAQTVYKVITDYGYVEKPNDVSYTNNPAKPAAPSREGYTFDRWQKTTGEGNTITYTAKWTPHTYSITASPSTLNFGSITEGEERPAAQTVTVKNNGNQTVTLNPPTAENFEIGKLSAKELKPDESATFTIQPKDKLPRGSYSEQIAISNTNGEKATITATFTVKEPPYTGKYSYEVFTSVGDNGTISVDRYATEGDKVTIDVTPDQAYKLDDLSVTAGGKEVTLTAGGDGTFSFTMPSADVRITATFAEDPDWTEPEEPATDVSDLFIDIAPDAWYKDAIQYAYDNGLMTGVSATEFAPEATTTRAMIVSILARLEGVTTAQAAGFADVDDNDWYATAVNWAANVGVVNGYEDNTFKPNTAITREQLAAILMNYAAYKGEDVSARADLTSYTDQPSTWAEEAISWSVAEGLISGVTADTLQPQGAATRAQVAAILQRFLSE